MKKTMMVFGYLFLALVFAIVATIASVALLGKKLDRESKAFVDAAIPAIVTDWDVTELQKRASPEFNEAVDYDELDEYFASLQQLGTFQEYKGATGDSNITVSLNGYEITADYTASVEFESGAVELQISLIRHGSQWQILDLKINPQEFTQRNDVV
jgi:hypothetical protein